MASNAPRAGTFLLYSWLVFGVAVSFNAYDAYLRVTPSVSSAQLKTDLHVQATELGNMMTFYFVPFVLLQIPVGLMIDRMGPRKLLALAVALSAAGSFLFGMSLSLTTSYGARLLMGIGGAFPGVGPIYLASRWFPPRYLGTLAGLTGTSTVIGSIGGQALLGRLLHVMSWRTASYIAAGIGLAIAVLIYLFVRDHPGEGHPLHKPKVEDEPRQSAGDLWGHVREIIAMPQNWLNSLWGSLTLMPMLAFAALWVDPFLIELYKVEADTAAEAASIMFLGLAFGGPVAGMVSEKLKSRRQPMMLFALLALACVAAILYVPMPFAAMYPLLFLFGFCLGSQGSLVFAVALEINNPRASGVAIGFTQGMSNLGGAVFPPVIGALLAYSAGAGASGGEEPTYTSADFRLALSVLPIGLGVAALAAFLMKESFAMPIAPGQEAANPQ